MILRVSSKRKSPLRKLARYRGGPLDGQFVSYFRLALYRDACGEPLRPRGSKVAAYLGLGGQIDGIYCIGAGEYVWVPAKRRKTEDGNA